MSSIKQVIVAAINKVSTAPEYAGREYTTPDDARVDFIRALMVELFPESEAVTSQEVVVPVQSPERKPTKEKKSKSPKTSPKKTAEEKAAEKEAAKAAKEAAKEAEKKAKAEAKEAEKQAKAAAKAAEKAAKAAEKVKGSPKASPAEKKAAKAEAKEAEKAAKAAAKAAEKAAAKVPLPASPVKAKKAKVPEGANLPKIDPTWRKHLKKADKEHAKALEPALLTYLNAMTAEEFNSKPAEEHVAAFLTKTPEGVEDEGKVGADLEIVEFEGKDYYVNPETKRVYEGEGVYDAESGGWTNYKPVGYVGMAAFAAMTLDA